jgi:Na+/H+ antiporter NhaD/arsenite permease-like protein
MVNNKVINKVIEFVKKESVLSAAILLAFVSALFVHPDKQYLGYIDYRTILILFSLMVVMEGYKKIGVFGYIAEKLLIQSNNITYIVFVLVSLCFFFSMVITNDVALITFVPFTFTVLSKLDKNTGEYLFIPVVILQTVSANLGSMLTPLGNPQNLYLYGVGGMTWGEFISLMAPYSIMGFCLIMISITVLCRNQGRAQLEHRLFNSGKTIEKKRMIIYSVMFALCILSVVRVADYRVVGLIIGGIILVIDRDVLKKIDYSLLGTFVFFFIFVGNVGRIEWFYDRLSKLVDGSEILISVLLSQFISNVPAALLLSDFTDDIGKLIVGLDIAGFGTLIASMASLISFRQVARENNGIKWKYLLRFSVFNIVVLATMLMVCYIIG